MPEYIEREAAMKELMNDAPEQVGYSREDAADCIRYMDAADVAPVMHGRWEVYFGGKELMCSSCKATFWDEEQNGGSNYCPNCGAKMDVGADHEA